MKIIESNPEENSEVGIIINDANFFWGLNPDQINDNKIKEVEAETESVDLLGSNNLPDASADLEKENVMAPL